MNLTIDTTHTNQKEGSTIEGISTSENSGYHKEFGKAINPFNVGGGFLKYCVNAGWIIQEGKGTKAHYFVTEMGKEELKKFDIAFR